MYSQWLHRSNATALGKRVVTVGRCSARECVLERTNLGTARWFVRLMSIFVRDRTILRSRARFVRPDTPLAALRASARSELTRSIATTPESTGNVTATGSSATQSSLEHGLKDHAAPKRRPKPKAAIAHRLWVAHHAPRTPTTTEPARTESRADASTSKHGERQPVLGTGGTGGPSATGGWGAVNAHEQGPFGSDGAGGGNGASGVDGHAIGTQRKRPISSAPMV